MLTNAESITIPIAQNIILLNNTEISDIKILLAAFK